MDSTEKTNLSKAQQQINHLQQTVNVYKERLREISAKLPKAELDALLFNLGIKDILEAPVTEPQNGIEVASEALSNGKLGRIIYKTICCYQTNPCNVFQMMTSC